MKPYLRKYSNYLLLIFFLLLTGCVSSRKNTNYNDAIQIRKIFEYGKNLMILANTGLYHSSIGLENFQKIAVPFNDKQISDVLFEDSLLLIEHSVNSYKSEVYYSFDSGIVWKKLELPYSTICYLHLDVYKEMIVLSNNNVSHGCDLAKKDRYSYYSLDLGKTWKIYDSLEFKPYLNNGRLEKMYLNIKLSLPSKRFSPSLYRLGTDTIINSFKRDKLKFNGFYYTTYGGQLFKSTDSLGHWDSVFTSKGEPLLGYRGNKSVIVSSSKTGVYYLMRDIDTAFVEQGLILTDQWDRVYVGEKHFGKFDDRKII